VSYWKRKAQKIRNELLAEAGCALAGSGKQNDPWPLLKAKLDAAFSDLIRMSHADDQGMVHCIDGCGEFGYWKDFDCGHFMDRDQLPTRWHLDNCRPQAPYCNRQKKGKRYEFGRALNAESPGLADRMAALSAEPGDQVRFTAPELLLEIRAKLKIQRKRLKHATRDAA
jgi:hypothetical protein